MFCVRFAIVRSDTTCWWVSARTSVSATRSATSSPGNDKNSQDSYLHSIHSIVFHFFQPWLGCMEAAMLGNPKCIFAKCTRLACLLSFPSFFQSRYPVPDQVEMGNDHGNCWLLRHCNSWEVSNHILSPEKRGKIICSTQVCQACVSGPAGGTDVDNCL